jgi:lytic murein transglycosylase
MTLATPPISLWRAALFALIATATLAFAFSPASAKSPPQSEGRAFQEFVAALWPLAQTQGVSRETFERAFTGVAFDPRVVAHTRRQAEFVQPIWQYIAGAASAARIERGRERLGAERSWVAKAAETYGVDASVVMGIWGLETDFGGFAGSDNVIRALASLAFIHFRGDYFRDELIAALVILQDGDIDAGAMRGSWAGAMGQTQFMPSSFLKYAVDFDGEGRRDIWTSAPDAIGSTANYLAKHGWKAGLPWGFEVRLPQGFRLTDADSSASAPFSSFAERGVRRADGRAMPQSGEGKLLLPAGVNGPVLIVTTNFDVIKTYNNSTAYALGVAILGDGVAGAGRIAAPWPTRDRPLSTAQTFDLQKRLQRLGYRVGDVDGRMGEGVRAAVRAYQEHDGLTPDGYANLALLNRLRAKP